MQLSRFSLLHKRFLPKLSLLLERHLDYDFDNNICIQHRYHPYKGKDINANNGGIGISLKK